MTKSATPQNLAVELVADVVPEILAVVAGLALVLVVALDSVSTLVTTRRRRGRHWPSPVFYRRTWRIWRAAVGRWADPDQRDGILAAYGPLSLLGLLVMWVLLMLAGWGAVWWGLRSRVTNIDGYLDAVYFAGTGFFTVGFGDLVPVGGLARMLLLAEAFMGLVTMALVIGYLPTLFAAYSRREVQLLALDDLSDEPTTPMGFLEASFANGGAAGIAAAFADWERWCDDVYDTHTTYPMLSLFRSRQPGQHWLTALGVIMDAAAICLATVEGSRAGPAARLWRRASRLLQTFRGLPAIRIREAEVHDLPGEEARFRANYQRLERLGLPLHPVDQAWSDLGRLRARNYPALVAATELLMVPMEFRHHTAKLDITSGG